MTERMPTGIKRLDDFLQGGLPPSSATLALAPPFAGADLLLRLFAITGMQQGMPTVFVLTDQPAPKVRKELASLSPAYADYEKAGLAHFVDAYSRTIGAADDFKFAEYVDGAVNLNAIALAVNNAQRKIVPEHAQHRIVLDSLSTLVAYTTAATAFRFLQVFIGKTKLAGATSLMHLHSGMHPDADVQMMRHLADGAIQLARENGKSLLQVEGLGVPPDRGWVEYKFGPTDFELTGSFAAGRIR